jgi:hypothetical protein
MALSLCDWGSDKTAIYRWTDWSLHRCQAKEKPGVLLTKPLSLDQGHAHSEDGKRSLIHIRTLSGGMNVLVPGGTK